MSEFVSSLRVGRDHQPVSFGNTNLLSVQEIKKVRLFRLQSFFKGGADELQQLIKPTIRKVGIIHDIPIIERRIKTSYGMSQKTSNEYLADLTQLNQVIDSLRKLGINRDLFMSSEVLVDFQHKNACIHNVHSFSEKCDEIDLFTWLNDEHFFIVLKDVYRSFANLSLEDIIGYRAFRLSLTERLICF